MHSDDQLPMREILESRAIPTSHDQAFQLWKHGINYPLFVPNLGPGVVELLQRGAVRELLVELQRRAELGSDSAASLLAYLSIHGISLDPRASSFATERCHAAATGGDSYAQFVLAWTRRKLNDDAGALEWMMKAATKGFFLPAFVDVGRFLAGGAGFKAPDRRGAIEVLWRAHRLGHRFALVYIARLMAMGFAGWARRPIGILLWLPAFIRAHVYSRFNP
jgi:hypothetical protein